MNFLIKHSWENKLGVYGTCQTFSWLRCLNIIAFHPRSSWVVVWELGPPMRGVVSFMAVICWSRVCVRWWGMELTQRSGYKTGFWNLYPVLLIIDRKLLWILFLELKIWSMCLRTLGMWILFVNSLMKRMWQWYYRRDSPCFETIQWFGVFLKIGAIIREVATSCWKQFYMWTLAKNLNFHLWKDNYGATYASVNILPK